MRPVIAIPVKRWLGTMAAVPLRDSLQRESYCTSPDERYPTARFCNPHRPPTSLSLSLSVSVCLSVSPSLVFSLKVVTVSNGALENGDYLTELCARARACVCVCERERGGGGGGGRGADSRYRDSRCRVSAQ